MDAVSVAKKYFELSNLHDFDAISDLFADKATYSSVSTGLYAGRDNIMEMMHSFHVSFVELAWTVVSLEEEKPNIAKVVFSMNGKKGDGEQIAFEGVEQIIVFDEKIQHIQITAR